MGTLKTEQRTEEARATDSKLSDKNAKKESLSEPKPVEKAKSNI